MKRIMFATLLALHVFVVPVLAGNLDPGAPPGPTMKSLDEIPPAWSQTLPAAERFVLVMGGAAVLDKETGLVWERTPISFYFSGGVPNTSWLQAFHTCYSPAIVVGNRRGWRLPTAEELASLLSVFEPTAPKLPAGHPFMNVLASRYWSATTYPGDTTFSYFVDFGAGNLSVSARSASYAVWCVRGGQGYNGQ